MEQEKILVELYDKKIHLMQKLETILGDDISLIYELLEVNQELNDLQVEEEIEVLD